MSPGSFALRRALAGIPLLIGVTLVSFTLMVYFGPDRTYELIGKNPTPQQIEEVRTQLGYDRPFWARYGQYLSELVRFDLGRSDATGEKVTTLLARSLPITLALMLPGYLLGNALGVLFGMYAAARRGGWQDRLVTGGAVLGMSLSLLVVVIVLQVWLCTPHGLNLFPVRGWDASSISAWARHVTVPTLAMIVVTLGYNTRFYRAVLSGELGKDHILAARAFGVPPAELLFARVLKNAAVPIVTRLLFSVPLVVVSGSIVLETFFGIPGMGKVTYDAISGGDQPVLKAVVALTAVAFVLMQFLADVALRFLDPRVADQ